jgi:hypothetical protein
MKRIMGILSIALLLATFITPRQTQAWSIPSATNNTKSPPVQYLRMGITIHSYPGYGNLAGRLASVSSTMQSNKDAHVFFAFPAVSGQRMVKEAKFYIINRTGSYSGTATMKLEIYDYAGTLQHVVSASSVNLQTVTMQSWTRLMLSSAITDRLIAPGEFLAFHFALDGAPGGDMDVRPVFEVTVGAISLYMPIVNR